MTSHNGAESKERRNIKILRSTPFKEMQIIEEKEPTITLNDNPANINNKLLMT